MHMFHFGYVLLVDKNGGLEQKRKIILDYRKITIGIIIGGKRKTI